MSLLKTLKNQHTLQPLQSTEGSASDLSSFVPNDAANCEARREKKS